MNDLGNWTIKNRGNIKFQNSEQRIFELDVFYLLIITKNNKKIKLHIYQSQWGLIVKNKRKQVCTQSNPLYISIQYEWALLTCLYSFRSCPTCIYIYFFLLFWTWMIPCYKQLLLLVWFFQQLWTFIHVYIYKITFFLIALYFNLIIKIFQTEGI